MTPTERRAALVEKVARAMCIVDGFDPDAITNNHTPTCPGPTWRLWVDAATAALTVALEEAALVAESHGWMADVEWWLKATKKEVSAKAAQEAAAAIRALIPEGSK